MRTVAGKTQTTAARRVEARAKHRHEHAVALARRDGPAVDDHWNGLARHQATAALLFRLCDAARSAPVFGSRLIATHSPSPPNRTVDESYSWYARPIASSTAFGKRPLGTRTVSAPVLRSVSGRKKSGELMASSTVMPKWVTLSSASMVRWWSPDPMEAKPRMGWPSFRRTPVSVGAGSRDPGVTRAICAC